MKKQKPQTIDTILEELTTKRGKHSELWMYPKKESLDNTKQQLLTLLLKALPEEKAEKPYQVVSQQGRTMAINATEVAYNQSLKDSREAIKRLFGEGE